MEPKKSIATKGARESACNHRFISVFAGSYLFTRRGSLEKPSLGYSPLAWYSRFDPHAFVIWIDATVAYLSHGVLRNTNTKAALLHGPSMFAVRSDL